MDNTAPPPDFKQRLKASYGAMAPIYNVWTEKHSPLRLAYLEKLYAQLPRLRDADKNISVLELGCGAGLPILDTILSRNPKLTAIANDLSDTQISLARKNLAQYDDRVRFAQDDMMRLSFPEGSLTAVVALYSIIHLPGHEQRDMVATIARWLEPGGCLLATFLPREMPSLVEEKWLDDKGWMYWSGLGESTTLQNLRDAEFRLEACQLEGDEEETFLWIIARKE
ncbi:S-adenosyl-L-methionine-dependent methyltransferase [Stachybotrys elegans]|uniref:S-adenosyl-L-methionine-dependent methyltransferase n=1 Tax=Stachybotrys elegans TaxID=80388 RepID=A0A8K0SUD7_9HYPO|nr:S-adenosyl-L-methionine-dependent methyltransferase [Stachybotrys elegans]